jgi:hypothetical protein
MNNPWHCCSVRGDAAAVMAFAFGIIAEKIGVNVISGSFRASRLCAVR